MKKKTKALLRQLGHKSLRKALNHMLRMRGPLPSKIKGCIAAELSGYADKAHRFGG